MASPSKGARMFTGSTKNPTPKIPQPERLDEVYSALRRGLQSFLQVHQLELGSLGQQIRESKRNGRLGSLYELDKQVKAIERFMRRLEFHLSKVEELYDAYCMQRRLRDGASKMVTAFNSATGSKEARESLNEANRGYREYTEHMCSLESELENQMGEFHIKMKGLIGYARLCAGDQYEVLMRYGRQRWRMKGRVEVSSKQVWDSEDNVFLPLITELLSIKVTELKSLANHVVVGSVSCETLDLFCPLPQTVAVDINDLGTVKLNLEVNWSPFDKDDQTSSSSTVSKRFLSNQSPPDTPSMREQVFYYLLRRPGELENGTVWSNSSESSDDSSSPAMGHTHRMMATHSLQTTPTIQISFNPRQSSVSTPSLLSNQEEGEPDATKGFGKTDSVKCTLLNGHLKCSRSLSHISERAIDCASTNRLSDQSVESSETPEPLPRLDLEVSCVASHCSNQDMHEALDLHESGGPESCVSTPVDQGDAPPASTLQAEKPRAGVEALPTDCVLGEGLREEKSSAEHIHRLQSTQPQELTLPEETVTVSGRSHSRSFSFTQEVETALESFDFLNCSDLDDEEEEEKEQAEEEEDEQKRDEKEKEQEKEDETRDFAESSDECEDDVIEIIVEAPEGFRNEDCPPLDADCSSEEEESSEQLQASSETKEEQEEEKEKEKVEDKKEEEQVTEMDIPATQEHGDEASCVEEPRSSTHSSIATTVL
ncbi:rho family-interacting cell polarization regulator 1 isoform X1 [Oncorhynchus mykiss]|uniref:rho family-interacting cell polarization regulator 1 isoform X1 n=1 Tax=Oncorhynchus mykiss TaxID=8022 RepID=UPI001878B908|nr:rho family-interacting cell polarization regulator 1 isoform X1 [Oncorhynchus mykiss]XP_021463101.2 rho family-interacting cell polarization regulator 1 isoform X1 [Oncorhynchus mykiss]